MTTTKSRVSVASAPVAVIVLPVVVVAVPAVVGSQLELLKYTYSWSDRIQPRKCSIISVKSCDTIRHNYEEMQKQCVRLGDFVLQLCVF